MGTCDVKQKQITYLKFNLVVMDISTIFQIPRIITQCCLQTSEEHILALAGLFMAGPAGGQ